MWNTELYYMTYGIGWTTVIRYNTCDNVRFSVRAHLSDSPWGLVFLFHSSFIHRIYLSSRNPEIIRVKATEIFLYGRQATMTTCNTSLPARLPRDSSPPGRRLLDDDLGAVETLGDSTMEGECHPYGTNSVRASEKHQKTKRQTTQGNTK